jgi:hypothetical protein
MVISGRDGAEKGGKGNMLDKFKTSAASSASVIPKRRT